MEPCPGLEQEHEQGEVRVDHRRSRRLRLVVADREQGKSFADTMPVIFTFYELKERGEDPLGPDYWFQAISTKKSSGPFCDVNQTFKGKLKL